MEGGTAEQTNKETGKQTMTRGKRKERQGKERTNMNQKHAQKDHEPSTSEDGERNEMIEDRSSDDAFLGESVIKALDGR